MSAYQCEGRLMNDEIVEAVDVDERGRPRSLSGGGVCAVE